MYVASILPLNSFYRTIENPYHMSLAQFIGGYVKYTKFFQNRIAEGKFVIMDNGAAEGMQPTIEELFHKIRLLNPSEIVLPDTIYNKELTLAKGEDAIFKLAEEFPEGEFQIMAVPQGETFKEWCECLDEMSSWPIDTIGISKFLTPKYGPNARYEAVKYVLDTCKKLGTTVQIHLLGCWDHPREIGQIEKAFGTFIRGTDSAVPYVYSVMGKTIEDSRPKYEMRFLDAPKLTDELEELLTDNIKLWEDYCNGKL